MERDDFSNVVECCYFTNQAFVRGEVIDANFQFIPTWSRLCWRGVARPPRVHAAQQKGATANVTEPQDREPHAPIDAI